jgi:hypothetical protein
MRLSEFANPKDYAQTATDAEDFQQQPLPIWHDRSADELAPSVLGSRQQPASQSMKRSDPLSIGSHVGGGALGSRGGALGSRRGARQRPAA